MPYGSPREPGLKPFTLKKVVYKAWGPKPILIKWIYAAIVRPRLTYCAVDWSHTLRYNMGLAQNIINTCTELVFLIFHCHSRARST